MNITQPVKWASLTDGMSRVLRSVNGRAEHVQLKLQSDISVMPATSSDPATSGVCVGWGSGDVALGYDMGSQWFEPITNNNNVISLINNVSQVTLVYKYETEEKKKARTVGQHWLRCWSGVSVQHTHIVIFLQWQTKKMLFGKFLFF